MRRVCWLGFLVTLLLLSFQGHLLAQPGSDIDWHRARELRQKQRQGESLTAEEQAYLDQAREQYRRQRQRKRSATAPATSKPVSDASAKETTGLIPLTELGEQRYKNQTGGLYGQGTNAPPTAHAQMAKRTADEIKPLDAEGRPAASGKIVLISLGMSNTKQEFDAFKKHADADPRKSSSVVIINCAQGGQDAQSWAQPDRPRKRDRPSPWVGMDNLIRQAGATAAQVQVVWIKQARRTPENLGEFPKHARALENDLILILHKLSETFPNLRIAYVSSRTYAGYAVSRLNPEPYAYESAFAVQWLIAKQMAGDPALNGDPRRGKVTSPLLLWGPYLWVDGVNPRKSDGLIFKREDFAGDGTHPSESGRQKVADMLLKFFLSDPYARQWFAR